MPRGPAIDIYPAHLAADVASHLAAGLVDRAAVVVYDHTAYYIFAVDYDYLHAGTDNDVDDLDHFFHIHHHDNDPRDDDDNRAAGVWGADHHYGRWNIFGVLPEH